tara:strand:- start:1498 stop:1800 length:303 start_codon:yes stop_codon:yes gene_type:complete
MLVGTAILTALGNSVVPELPATHLNLEQDGHDVRTGPPILGGVDDQVDSVYSSVDVAVQRSPTGRERKKSLQSHRENTRKQTKARERATVKRQGLRYKKY